MTEAAMPGILPSPAPGDDRGYPTEPDGQTGPVQVPGEGRQRNRRKAAVLIVLSLLLGLLVAFTAWYLVNRKPISQLIPQVTVDQLPTYQFSMYGAMAPTGVAVSADGSRIYATQGEGEAKVVIFDGSGKPLGDFGPPVKAGDHVFVYVAVDPLSGDVYASDRPAGAVYVYDANGGYKRTFDPGPTLRAAWSPLGLGFDRTGNLYVTNVSGPYQAVDEFGPDGQFIQAFGQPGLFNFPNGVAVDGHGDVYVSDSNNGRLVVFDATGKQLALVRRGSADDQLGLPRGVAVDDQDRVYVADITTQGVQIYHGLVAGAASLKFVGHVGNQGSTDGAFQFPNAVAVDGRARVYVADWRNNRIQVWTY